MTRATHWLYQARDLAPEDDFIVNHPAARRMLSHAAIDRMPVGSFGWLYKFADGSRLLTGSAQQYVMED